MPEIIVEVKEDGQASPFCVDRLSRGDGFLPPLVQAARAVQELAAPPVADAVTGQAAGLGAQHCHDQHHKDVELPLTGQTAAQPTTAAPIAGIPANDSAMSAKTAR